MTIVIAVDGDVAAGKGTLARRLAADLGFAYLDTGTLYRAAAFRLLALGGDPDDPEAAGAAAAAITPEDLASPDLRREDIGQTASRIAALAPVRAALLDFQRDFAARPPEGARGAILDGRDIGTVVCPDAAVKLYVTASAEVRAGRRLRELQDRGETADFDTVLADLRRRDARDSERKEAPLRAAPDAHLLDTTNLDIEAAFAAAKTIVARVL
jgi:cytidylate kinase